MEWELAETHATPPEVTPEQLITSLIRAATKNRHYAFCHTFADTRETPRFSILPPRPEAEIKCSPVIKGLATHLTLLARQPHFFQFLSASCHFAFYKVHSLSAHKLNSVQ